MKQRPKTAGSSQANRKAKILILGAGPAGLSAAWFLRRQGYSEITLLERQSHVGGFCRSMVDHLHAIDLGATYVSPEFKEVVALARACRVKLVHDRGVRGFRFDPVSRSASTCGLLNYVAEGSSLMAQASLARLILSYLRQRQKVEPQLAQVAQGKAMPTELDCDLLSWLRERGLERLVRVFEGPITSFGYGSLGEVPAYYALRYMTPRAFGAALLSLIPGSSLLPGWLILRRFRDGYQRLWEEVSHRFDIRLQSQVESIRRDDCGVHVTWTHPDHSLIEADSRFETSGSFDHLIVACSLADLDLPRICDLDDHELDVIRQPVQTIHYAIVNAEVDGLQVPAPLLVRVPAVEFGQPMIVAKPNPQGSVVSICTRLPGDAPLHQELEEFKLASEDCIEWMGGKFKCSHRWFSSEVIDYFHHYNSAQLRSGILGAWRDLQGYRSTYYTGGLFDFDHVEGAVRASRRLIEAHFSS